MRILLTGGCGFIGSHFVEAILKETDWEVVILDGLNYAADPNRLFEMEDWDKLKDRVKFVWWDLRSELNFSIEKEVGEIDYLLHLAAETHVDRSIAGPKNFVMTNVLGTFHLLEYIKVRPVKKFLYFSTDEVFGPAPADYNFTEADRHAPGNPYAATKAGAEDLCLSYANTYNLPIVITNTMNIFGERQHPEKFIPMTISKVLKEETNIIHSDPTLTRAGSRFYLHAKNAWRAIYFVLTQTDELLKVKDPQSGRFNIVGDREIDNLALASFIAEIVGKPLKYEMVNFHESRPGHDLRYGLNGGKLKGLGFEFPKTFEESLTETIKWSLSHKKWLRL